MTRSTHGGPGRGQGRKPDRGTPRTELIPIRATEADKAELTAAAETADQTLSEFMLEAGLDRARRR